MIRKVRNIAILGTAGALFSVYIFGQSAQQLAEQASRKAEPASTIPADQQPSPEQLSKLFEVMRIKQQMASMRMMVPGMVQQQI
jgi:hypothetical protein